MSVLISIIIPVHNAEYYLDDCLKSILNQESIGTEVIIINDGSIDGSKKIIERYKNIHKNIICIDQENQGVSQARNNGIDKATGSYILFLDADDIIVQGLLKDLKEAVENYGCPDIISFGYLREGGSKKTNRHYSFRRFDKRIFIGTQFTRLFLSKEITQHVCSFIIKREVVLNYNLKFDRTVSLGEDIAFQIKAMSIAKKVLYLAEEGFIYRYNAMSQTNKKYKKAHLSCTKNYLNVKQYLVNNNLQSLISYLNFYYQYMFFYELKSFMSSEPEVLNEYLASDAILKHKSKFIYNKAALMLYLLRLFYQINRKFVYRLLR